MNIPSPLPVLPPPPLLLETVEEGSQEWVEFWEREAGVWEMECHGT